MDIPNIVLIGPPGAGKSTIASRLVAQLPLTIIATGQRLRAEIAAKSPIGRQIEPLLEQGHFAPDSLMDDLMRQWLAEVPEHHGVLLDGYPRSPQQAHTLEGMLAALQRPLSAVIALELSEDEAIRRLSGRRMCVCTNESFTLHISDKAAMERCRALGGMLTQRDDDAPAVIAERMRVYASETEPLLKYYEPSGLLHHVNAHGSPEEVTAQVVRVVNGALRRG